MKKSNAELLESLMKIKTVDCIEWPRGKDSLGYGLIYWKGQMTKCHRVSYELANGKIPDGLQIDHLCRNSSCLNHRHLEAVTLRTNVLRGVGPTAENSRKTRCRKGHSLSENLYVDKYKNSNIYRRRCLLCKRESGRAWSEKNRTYAPEKTQCKNGHSYSQENTRYIKYSGYEKKICIICARSRSLRWYRKQRDAD